MVIKSLADIDLSQTKGVLIDLDDTLYPYHNSHEYALEACIAEFISLDETHTRENFLTAYKNARTIIGTHLKGQASSHSRLLYFQYVFEALYSKTCYAYSLQFEELYWSSFMDAMVLTEDAKLFLHRCKEAQINVCLITDLTAQIQHRKIIRLGITEYIKYMVSSEEAGQEKPERVMFDIALRKLNLIPDEVIMIGDSLEKDIKGASQSGIKAFQVKL